MYIIYRFIYVQVPNLEQRERIQLGFGKKWNFPSCCGAIDGKHVFIQAPSNSGSEYFNYKNRNSIILIVVVDHQQLLSVQRAQVNRHSIKTI